MQRSVRRLTVAGLIVVAAAAAGWAAGLPGQGDAVERVVGIASTALTAWLVFEVHEERLTRDRPFVFVDFVPRTESQGSPGATLRIRNTGRSPAVDVHIKPSVPLLDRVGSDLLQNPVLREGISFLGPSWAMAIDLHEDTVLDQLYDQAPTYRLGETPPPHPPLRVTCCVAYRDGITGRRYSETFTVELDVQHLGWTTVASTA